MTIRLHSASSIPRLGLWLGVAACGVSLLLPAGVPGQGGKGHGKQDKNATPVEKSHPDRMPGEPTIPPAFTIPIDPLGFSPPARGYLGMRFAMASLDFLDEDRVLFTFRIPGLIRRQLKPGEEAEGGERHIKAVVLAISSGAVQAEAMWAMHDRARYLWMLKDGHFLVRDRNELLLGDATLELKSYLRFPGPVLGLGMDPSQQFLVTNSREPASVPGPGEVPRPATAAADVAVDNDSAKTQPVQPELVMRIIRRDSGKVMLVSRVRAQVHLPINSEGYLELLPGRDADWVVNLNRFTGGSAKLGEVDSTCTPSYDFLSQREFLISACTRSAMRRFVAMSTDGHRLWEDLPSSSPVWPLVVVSADGSRLARESLAVNRPVTAFSPLDFDDIKGQVVNVFDAATGKVVLVAPLDPVFDAGGNVAISPSGRRVAVLRAGAIQVFDLPAPAAAPADPNEDRASKSGP